MNKILIRKDAESDISQAYNWYEEKSQGLGDNFLQAVEDTLSRISFNPFIYPIVHENIRRSFTRKFPFGIFYIESTETTIVLAVMHVRKDPGRWLGRE